MTLYWINTPSIRVALVGVLLFGINFLAQAHELRPSSPGILQSALNQSALNQSAVLHRFDTTPWEPALSQVPLLLPDPPQFAMAERPAHGKIAGTYFALGVEHILLGIDHLLFVLALVVLVSGWRQLITTITAFTLAHSITLALAVLGMTSVPQGPVEAVIALSIVFVAVEILHKLEGRKTLAIRKPWLVAFGFGLLHGFGFAGALSEIGVPDHAIRLSLAVFNLGVETGQLAFILAIGALMLLLRRMPSVHQWEIRTGHTATVASALPVAYIVGGVSAWWLIDRTIALVV